MPKFDITTPDRLNAPVQPFDLSQYNIQLLAQGDSWFSLGAILPSRTSNLFEKMGTSVTQGAVVNCASPGRWLAKMTDKVKEQAFLRLISGRTARTWSGILLSGGGNDVIDAVQSPPSSPLDQRLLLTQPEWTVAPGAQRYLSNSGWITFSDHLTMVIQNLLALRDSTRSNVGIPVVMHTYDFATPRNASAGPGVGPWLYKAVNLFGIPQQDWVSVGRELLMRLQTLLLHIAATTPDNSLHIVCSQGTLTEAAITDKGATADWENEIHPTSSGYGKLGKVWQPVLDAVFDTAATTATDP